VKCVTLVKLAQLGVGAKNGMIGMDKLHWHYQKCHWGLD